MLCGKQNFRTIQFQLTFNASTPCSVGIPSPYYLLSYFTIIVSKAISDCDINDFYNDFFVTLQALTVQTLNKCCPKLLWLQQDCTGDCLFVPISKWRVVSSRPSPLARLEINLDPCIPPTLSFVVGGELVWRHENQNLLINLHLSNPVVCRITQVHFQVN